MDSKVIIFAVPSEIEYTSDAEEQAQWDEGYAAFEKELQALKDSGASEEEIGNFLEDTK